MNKINEKKSAVFLLILCFLFYSLDYFFRISQSIVVVELADQYQVGVIGVAAFASAFYLGYALLQIPSGYMLDRYRLNTLMGVAIILCSVCYLFFLYANLFWLGYLLRVIIGATSALSFIGVLYIARLYVRPTYFSFLAGLAISIGTFSASVVQFIGVFFIKFFDWHYALGIFGILACVIGLLFFAFSVPKKQVSQSFDLRSIGKALLDLGKRRVLVYNAIIGGIFYLPTTILASLWGVPFMISHYKVSKITATTAIMFLFLGWAIGAPLFAIAANYFRKHYQLVSVAAFFGIVFSLLFLYLSNISNVLLFVIMLCFGLASSAQVLVWKIFDLHCPQQLSGLGIATTNMIIMLCGSVFHLIIGLLIGDKVDNINAIGIPYQRGLLLIPVLFCSVIFAAFLLKKNLMA